MLFIYLFILSIIGISVIGIIDYRKRRISLLQNIRNSCNIDSVHFEKCVQLTGNYLRKQHCFLKKNLLHSLKYIERIFESLINKTKAYIRKKFHPDTPKKNASLFIENMKKGKSLDTQ